jgi:hypothetical protein
MYFAPKPSRDSSSGPCKHSRFPAAAAASNAAAAVADGVAGVSAAAAAAAVAAAAVGAAAAIDLLRCRHCPNVRYPQTQQQLQQLIPYTAIDPGPLKDGGAKAEAGNEETEGDMFCCLNLEFWFCCCNFCICCCCCC